MIEKIFSFIDNWLNAIPYKVRKIITYSFISLWIVMAIAVSLYSFLKGRENAPVVSEQSYLNEIKEKIQEKQNLNKKRTIILPDLNDLVQEEVPLKIESSDQPKQTDIAKDLSSGKNIQILPQKDELIFPEKQEPIPEQKGIEIEELKNNTLPEKKEKTKNKQLEILKIEK